MFSGNSSPPPGGGNNGMGDGGGCMPGWGSPPGSQPAPQFQEAAAPPPLTNSIKWGKPGGNVAPASWRQAFIKNPNVAMGELACDFGCVKLQLPPEAMIAQMGFAHSAPAVYYEKNNPLYANAEYMLTGFEGHLDVSVIDDPQGTQFPEVQQAIRNAGGDATVPYAIAQFPSRGLWGVGLAQGSHNRDTAARLALVCGIGWTDNDVMWHLMRNYPDFKEIVGPPTWGRYPDSFGGAGMGCKSKAVDSWGGEELKAGEAPPVTMIQVANTSPLIQQGFVDTGPAVYHGGKNCRAVFENAHFMLAELVSNNNVEIHDDEEGHVFPDIHASLAASGFEPCSISVAVNRETRCWGVGAGWSKKFRDTAAKLSLALAVAGRTGRAPHVARMYPDFAIVAKSVGIMDESTAMPPMQQGGMGMQQNGMGTQQYGMGMQQNGMGIQHGGMSMQQGGMGMQNGMGMQQNNMGMQQNDMGMQQNHMGGNGMQNGMGMGVPSSASGNDMVIPQGIFITLLPTSKLVQQGLANVAPAVYHMGKGEKGAFSNSSYILNDVVGEQNVELFDDDQGTEFPDVVQAVQEVPGFEEAGVCIAACMELQLSGVGVGWGKKFREQASRLALAIAVAQAQDKSAQLGAKYPEFGILESRMGPAPPAMVMAVPAMKKPRLEGASGGFAPVSTEQSFGNVL